MLECQNWMLLTKIMQASVPDISQLQCAFLYGVEHGDGWTLKLIVWRYICVLFILSMDSMPFRYCFEIVVTLKESLCPRKFELRFLKIIKRERENFMNLLGTAHYFHYRILRITHFFPCRHKYSTVKSPPSSSSPPLLFSVLISSKHQQQKSLRQVKKICICKTKSEWTTFCA